MNNDIITHLYKTGYFSRIDTYFARFICEISGQNDPDIFLAAALASQSTGKGDVCLDLAFLAEKRLFEEGNGVDAVICPKLLSWRKKLLTSPAIGEPGDYRPLVLDEKNRLYLYRYWEYEKVLSESIEERVNDGFNDIDATLLGHGIKRLFPTYNPETIDWQKVAVIPPVFKRFSVISGGPGTGKTFTVAKIIVLLLEQARGNQLRIFLCAPTGKAAAKLGEFIKAAKEKLNCGRDVKALIPAETYTIHRMLRPVPGTPYFRYNRENPLPADVVLIDESSMVDLALMAKLVEAVPSSARLILMGDKDQLASVEAGSVLGDICDRDAPHGYSDNFVKNVEKIADVRIGSHCHRIENRPGLHDGIVLLRESHRFAGISGIGALSRAVNRGDSEEAIRLLEHPDPEDRSIKWERMHVSENPFQMLEKKIVEGYSEYLQTDNPQDALELFNRFKILCAVKKGPFGVDTVNRFAEHVLARRGLIDPDFQFYRGKPILITRNDYDLGLYNGDIGILMPMPESDRNDPYAFFSSMSGELRRFPAYRLGNYETVYALTVHKSQGSEFESVLLILPDKFYPVLSRELLYTGITRAKKQVTIWGSENILASSIQRKIARTSGLRDALWGKGKSHGYGLS